MVNVLAKRINSVKAISTNAEVAFPKILAKNRLIWIVQAMDQEDKRPKKQKTILNWRICWLLKFRKKRAQKKKKMKKTMKVEVAPQKMNKDPRLIVIIKRIPRMKKKVN